ncbi:MAG TPA: hypothetical protein VGW10_12760 [Solirubrobacteraceae bacterium]|nr:hypothetical protein [Solirubrobacteraceae bacterium]
MSRAWLAVVGGQLRVWRQRSKPVRGALRVDPRMLDEAGAAATVSLVLAPAGMRVLFDDLAVQQARRVVLARPAFDGVSTLLRDSSHFAGAITVARGSAQVARLHDDPFARIFRAMVLDVGAGVLGAVPPPAGPTIERYGSAEPWPWDRFV